MFKKLILNINIFYNKQINEQMGNSYSSTITIPKISFEDLQHILKHRDESFLLIHTLNDSEQECLIPYTLRADQEERILNECIKKQMMKQRKIVIYGKNANDEKIYTKYNQLQNLGFHQVFLYPGGLFEWLLLQDIYGSAEFSTTKQELDLLKFKPKNLLVNGIGGHLLEF